MTANPFPKHNSNKLNFFSNAIWIIVERISILILLFITDIFVARHLGPQDYGELRYFIAIIAFMVPLSSFGLNSVISHYLVKQEYSDAELIGTSLLLRFFGSFISLGLIVFAAIFFLPIKTDDVFFLIILGVASLFNILGVINIWIQTRLLTKQSMIGRVTLCLVLSSLKMTLVIFEAGLPLFIYATAAESVLIGFFYLFFYISQKYRGASIGKLFTTSRKVANRLVRHSASILLLSILFMCLSRVDQIMIASMLSVAHVGQYAIAVRITEIWFFIPQAIVISYFPKYILKLDTIKTDAEGELQKLCAVVILVSSMLAISTSILSTIIVPLLYGEAYKEAGEILSIQSWSIILIACRIIILRWSLIESTFRTLCIIHISGLAINIFFNYLFIPKFGTIGAAYATILSLSFVCYWALFIFKDTRPLAIAITKSPIKFGYLLYRAYNQLIHRGKY